MNVKLISSSLRRFKAASARECGDAVKQIGDDAGAGAGAAAAAAAFDAVSSPLQADAGEAIERIPDASSGDIGSTDAARASPTKSEGEKTADSTSCGNVDISLLTDDADGLGDVEAMLSEPEKEIAGCLERREQCEQNVGMSDGKDGEAPQRQMLQRCPPRESGKCSSWDSTSSSKGSGSAKARRRCRQKMAKEEENKDEEIARLAAANFALEEEVRKMSLRAVIDKMKHEQQQQDYEALIKKLVRKEEERHSALHRRCEELEAELAEKDRIIDELQGRKMDTSRAGQSSA